MGHGSRTARAGGGECGRGTEAEGADEAGGGVGRWDAIARYECAGRVCSRQSSPSATAMVL
eukprot:2375880-Prymnesium_polylepis.1